MKSPWVRGAVAGSILSITLLAIFYFCKQLNLLPFIPFDLFDWMSKVLPGWIIIPVIEVMVKIIHLISSGPTDVVAKSAEQTIAIVQFIILQGITGLLVSLLLNRFPGKPYLIGTATGIVFIICYVLLELALKNPFSVINAVLLIFIVVGWTISLVFSLQQLQLPEKESEKTRDTDESRRKILVRIAGVSLGTALTLGITGKFISTERTKVDLAEEPLDQVKPSTGAIRYIRSIKNVEKRTGIIPVEGTRREITPRDLFFRIDIDSVPPVIDIETWKLQTHGLFRNKRDLTYKDILAYPEVTLPATLCCVSNPVGGDLISTGFFTGVHLSDMLKDLGIQSDARALMVRAIDGYYESISYEDMYDENTLLVYGLNGYTLSARQGFPVRFFIPDRYGMKQPKWITHIEAVKQIDSGFWVDRGWDREARPHILSIIDTLVVDDNKEYVSAGGIAWAGNRGIIRVEIKVDDSTWEDAKLLKPALNKLTWVLWRYDWPAQRGRHVFTVRATDGTGTLQIGNEHQPPPAGATGYNEKKVQV